MILIQTSPQTAGPSTETEKAELKARLEAMDREMAEMRQTLAGYWTHEAERQMEIAQSTKESVEKAFTRQMKDIVVSAQESRRRAEAAEDMVSQLKDQNATWEEDYRDIERRAQAAEELVSDLKEENASLEQRAQKRGELIETLEREVKSLKVSRFTIIQLQF